MSEKTLKFTRPTASLGISNIGKQYLKIIEQLIDVPKYAKRLSKSKELELEFIFESYKISESINELHPHKNCGEVYFRFIDNQGDEYGKLAGFKFAETTNCCGSMSVQEKFSNITGCGIGKLLEYFKEDIFLYSTAWSNYCTVPTNMISNVKLLENCNWKVVDEFVNHNSQNTVRLYNKKIERKLDREIIFRNPNKYKSIYAKSI